MPALRQPYGPHLPHLTLILTVEASGGREGNMMDLIVRPELSMSFRHSHHSPRGQDARQRRAIHTRFVWSRPMADLVVINKPCERLSEAIGGLEGWSRQGQSP